MAGTGAFALPVIGVTMKYLKGASALAAVARVGMTELQLVNRAANYANKYVKFTKNAGVTGTLKHTAAKRYLHLYQLRSGKSGLSLESNYFNNNALLGTGNRGFLDVVNHRTKTIYDFKFGDAFMSNDQYLKYSRNFKGYTIEVIDNIK